MSDAYHLLSTTATHPDACIGAMASTKRITIDQLKPGMFVVAMDQPWYRTPFLFHKRLIAGPDDIDQMRRHGIHEITIDIERDSTSTPPVAVVTFLTGARRPGRATTADASSFTDSHGSR
ncbi:MAG: DUF3391 domain-containing protein [Nitrospiraceae bacterium]